MMWFILIDTGNRGNINSWGGGGGVLRSIILNRRIILDFLCTLSNTDSTVSEDAGIEPRTVVTLTLAAY
jgi:hypothetical protein